MTIFCLIYSKCVRRNRMSRAPAHPIYYLINQYLFFNILVAYDVCLKVVSSPIVRNSRFFMYKTSTVCTVDKFLAVFVESVQMFQLTLVWLIMLAERGVFPRARLLYADYEIAQSKRDNNTIRSEVAKLREKTFTNCVTRNSRGLILVAFYTLAFFVASALSPSFVYYHRTTQICIFRGSSEVPYAMRLAIEYFFFMPTLYYLLAITVWFGQYFGGELDPVRASLVPSDLDRIGLVKKLTLLKCVIKVATEIHMSSYLFLSTTLYEILRVLGLLAVLASILIFMWHENMHTKITNLIFSATRGTGGSNSSASVSEQPVNHHRSPHTVVDYTNLVENDN